MLAPILTKLSKYTFIHTSEEYSTIIIKAPFLTFSLSLWIQLIKSKAVLQTFLERENQEDLFLSSEKIEFNEENCNKVVNDFLTKSKSVFKTELGIKDS